MKVPSNDEFAGMLAPHLPALFRAAYRLTHHRADAEDLVQDVCLKAHADMAGLESATSPKAWLLKIQYRTFIDGLRRRTRSPLHATGEDFDATRAIDSPSPEDAADGALVAQQLAVAWQALAPIQRALLALHAEGYTLTEIECITDLSTDVLKARLYRARLRLGKLLATEHDASRLALEH